MSSFNPQKLSVAYLPPATSARPVEGRKYTLTHSDTTAELFLDVGYVYNIKAINPTMRDEVIAEWQRNDQGQFRLMGKAYISGGEFDENESQRRFNIFKREMNTALKGMIYGDRAFFIRYPSFLDAPIYIYYQSIYPQFSTTLYYGTPRTYLSSLKWI